MNYAYIRVSSDSQTTENQRSMINDRGYKIDEWLCDEAVSGTVDWHKRSIEKAVNRGNSGDTIIVAEISRIGRSLKQILEVVELCQKKQIRIVCIREGIELSDNNPMTKLIISILGGLAEMERNLISERTKDALKRKRANGIILGRPVGTGGQNYCKLAREEENIRELLINQGLSFSKTSKVLNVHRGTLMKYLNMYMPEVYEIASARNPMSHIMREKNSVPRDHCPRED